MALSEFRYNKKRKHYSYLFKSAGPFRKCILFTTKPTRIWKKKTKNNYRLFKHPNPSCEKTVYVIPRIYVDHAKSFHKDSLNWQFDRNDKRRIKRIIKEKKWRQNKTGHALTSIKTGVGPVLILNQTDI